MCLRLTYAEAMLWKAKAKDLISGALKAKIAPDPLLKSVPHISQVVSAVESIKKRHGVLIEDALIAAIKKLAHWDAGKSIIPRKNGSVFKTDCVAVNQQAGIAYVFECKRQYASFDGDKKRAIDARLDEIAVLFPAFALSQG